jgi:hypothetical protein
MYFFSGTVIEGVIHERSLKFAMISLMHWLSFWRMKSRATSGEVGSMVGEPMGPWATRLGVYLWIIRV